MEKRFSFDSFIEKGILLTRDTNFFQSFTGIIGNNNINVDTFSMIIHLKKLQFFKSETFGMKRTSLSSVHSRCKGAGDIIKSLCASITGCGAGIFGAYVSFLIANRTELRLCDLSSFVSAT